MLFQVLRKSTRVGKQWYTSASSSGQLLKEWEIFSSNSNVNALASFIQQKWNEQHEKSIIANNSYVKHLPSLPKMLAELVEVHHFEINPLLASHTASRLNEINSQYHHVGLLHLLDAYLEIGDLSGAHHCYESLCKEGFYIEQSCVERFMTVAAKQCSISHMKLLFQNQRVISRRMILVAAEPLILSGYTKTLSQLLEKYLATSPELMPVEIASIVKEILKARVRRSLINCPLSALEVEGVDHIETLLNEYSDRYGNGMDNSVLDDVALQGIENYLSFCSDWNGETAPEDFTYSSYDQSMPIDVDTCFDYLEEERSVTPIDYNLEERPSQRFLFEDITAQIAKQRPFVYPLYNGAFFREEAEREIIYAETVANDIFFAVEFINEEDADDSSQDDEFESESQHDFDNSDDESDEFNGWNDEGGNGIDNPDVKYELEVDDSSDDVNHSADTIKFFETMRSAGCTQKLVDYPFQDMSQNIRSSYSTILLEYAEDVFDGISEDSFVKDGLMNNRKKDIMNNNNKSGKAKLIEGIIHSANDDSEKKGPDDNGGVTFGLRAPTSFKEES